VVCRHLHEGGNALPRDLLGVLGQRSKISLELQPIRRTAVRRLRI
jgi:hypothetical protein